MREIKGAPGYFITEAGDVFSTRRGVKVGTYQKLKPQKSHRGYLMVDLRSAGKGMSSVHRLVAETFLDGLGETVNHKDGNKLNNHVHNLEWMTFHENQLHHFRTLKRHNGDEHWNTKLTAKDMKRVKELTAMGTSQKEVAKLYGVDPSLISKRLSL